MFSIEKMRKISQTENVIFHKHGCPFCAASDELFEELVNRGIIESFSKYYLGENFTDELLTQLVKEYGWVGGQYQLNCTKPQIFIAGEFIGGNFEFYKSKWNVGEKDTGKIKIEDQEFEAPHLINPMPF